MHIEPKVMDLLVTLAENRDRVVSKDELLEILWPDAVVGDAALSRLVKEARRAVGDDGSRQSVIKTHHGRGFRFVAAVSELASNEPVIRVKPYAAIEGDTLAEGNTGSGSESRRVSSLGLLWLFPEIGKWSVPLNNGLTLGRSESCDTRLYGQDASRLHATLYRQDSQLVLRDLSSRNGTYVNGARIVQATLASGDVVRLGEWVGVVASRAASRADGGLREVAPGLLVGSRMQKKLSVLQNSAVDQAPVAIIGETGCGKGSIARALHSWGSAPVPLMTISCAARPETFSLEEFLQKELAGATSAMVVLDNVTELGARAQGELLRLIDAEHLLTPSSTVSVRFVVTSERSLAAAVAGGGLRPDLCARLSAVVFEVPPLRERIEEIPALFVHFLRRHAGREPPPIHARLIERLCLYDWPFNVRELEHLARQLLMLPHEDRLHASLLPNHVKAAVELDSEDSGA